jgi:hypothetical protein
MPKGAKVTAEVLPTTKIATDDCIVKVAGRAYRPHAGQYISVCAAGSIGDVELSLQLAGLGDTTDMTPEQAAAAAAKIGAIIERIVDAIVDWDWTDRRSGKPLPNPPDVATIRSLSLHEINYLVRKLVTGLAEDTEDDRKNGDSPST